MNIREVAEKILPFGDWLYPGPEDIVNAEKLWEIYEKEIARIIEAIEETDKWVSVNDRLPVESGPCILNHIRVGSMNGWYQKGEGFYHVTGDYNEDDILHWMPLPEPPQD